MKLPRGRVDSTYSRTFWELRLSQNGSFSSGIGRAPLKGAEAEAG